LVSSSLLQDFHGVNSPSISVLGSVLALAVASNIDTLEQDVRRVGDKVVPLRGIAQLERADSTAVQTDNTNQNGTQDESIRSVQVVPNLTIAVQGTVTIDVDICTTELEEGRRILVDLLEGIGLPVVGIVGELDCSEDFYDNVI
jgi:hypothetical protein